MQQHHDRTEQKVRADPGQRAVWNQPTYYRNGDAGRDVKIDDQNLAEKSRKENSKPKR
jgi:hypothetical protein